VKSSIISIIVEQHAEEAAFLWLLRDAAVRAPHYSLKDPAHLDDRVEAYIDGLRIAGEAGWEICKEALGLEEPGEVFAAAVLALENRNPTRIEEVFVVAETVPETVRGLTSAFGWVSPPQLQGTVKDLLVSTSPFRRRIGIAACAVHRVDPKAALQAAIIDDDPLLQARALRAVGELGRKDLLPVLRQQLRVKDDAYRFWAAWSAVLLGDRGNGLELLKLAVASESAFRESALQLALWVMDGASAREWLKGLVQYPDRLRDVVIGTGITGDPMYIPWLIKQMKTPALARIAGEAFTLITGVNIAYEDLEGERPEGFETGPTENPEDEDVAMDPDEDLPWPDPRKIQSWWDTNKGRFQAGVRHLVGKPITVEHCQRVLASGYQRQRIAAALELSLMQPDRALFEVRAPGWRQQRLLKV
jgi:uncharacterized protein (TIGR02270 family)